MTKLASERVHDWLYTDLQCHPDKQHSTNLRLGFDWRIDWSEKQHSGNYLGGYLFQWVNTSVPYMYETTHTYRDPTALDLVYCIASFSFFGIVKLRTFGSTYVQYVTGDPLKDTHLEGSNRRHCKAVLNAQNHLNMYLRPIFSGRRAQITIIVIKMKKYDFLNPWLLHFSALIY